MSERVAIITGATRGIGLGITKQLLKDGYKICAFGTRNIEDYDEFSKIYDEEKFSIIRAISPIKKTGKSS